MHNIKLGIFFSLLIFSQVAFSFGGGMSFKDGLFWSVDLNRNEQLTLQEAKNVYHLGKEEVFNKYDQSGEGLISKFEFFHYLDRRTNDE